MSITSGRHGAHLPGLMAALEALVKHLERDAHGQVLPDLFLVYTNIKAHTPAI